MFIRPTFCCLRDKITLILFLIAHVIGVLSMTRRTILWSELSEEKDETIEWIITATRISWLQTSWQMQNHDHHMSNWSNTCPKMGFVNFFLQCKESIWKYCFNFQNVNRHFFTDKRMPFCMRMLECGIILQICSYQKFRCTSDIGRFVYENQFFMVTKRLNC